MTPTKKRETTRQVLGVDTAVWTMTSVGLQRYDKQGRLSCVNPAFLDLFGVTAPDAIKDFDLFSDPNLPKDTRDVLKKGKPVRYQAPIDFERVHKDRLFATTRRGLLWLDVCIEPMGQPLEGYLVHVQDITRERLTMEALAESEAKLMALYKTSSAAVSLTRMDDGVIVEVNPAWTALFGVEKIEALEQTYVSLGLVRDKFDRKRAYAELDQNGRILNREVAGYRNRNHEDLYLLVDAEKVSINGVNYVYALARDISVRKKREAELKDVSIALRVVLDQREKEKKELADTLSSNVQKRILPYLEQMVAMENSHERKMLAAQIVSNLEDVMAPFGVVMTRDTPGLTPTELQVADMIRNGMASKEIAALLKISLNAVGVHRYHIRQKLGLLNKKSNLRNVLLQMP